MVKVKTPTTKTSTPQPPFFPEKEMAVANPQPKILAMTFCRRAWATKKMLEDILPKCIGIEEYDIFVSIDFDERYEAYSTEVAEIVQRFADSGIAKSVRVWEQHPRLGIDLNKLFILKQAFEHSNYVVFLEDDTPISPDGLKWFEFGNQEFAEDENIFSISGFNRSEDRLPGEVDPLAFEAVRGYCPWGVGVWKDKYITLFGDNNEKYLEYAKDHANGLHDAYIDKAVDTWRVRPLLSRTMHSEWELAEHTESKEWFEQYEKTTVWAGALGQLLPTDGYSLQSSPRKNLRIVFDCDGGGSPGGWWPDSHLEGKFSGGSEEQLMYFAKELATIGHKVIVRNDCRDHEGVYDRVQYLNYMNHEAPNCDVYCAQRNRNLLRTRKAPVQILLCHDIPVSDHMFSKEEIERGALKEVDFCILLNEYHRRLYLEHGVPDSKIRVCPIMVPLEPFNVEVERISGRCVYCSCPERGLRRLIDYWPRIKELAPHATLQICWRFSIAHDQAHGVDRPWFEEWEKGIPSLGVLPLLNCSHEELAVELSKAELLVYPSHFNPEISPASTIKAQIAGAVPLVVIAGGMDDTVRFGHRADFGDFPIAASNALNDVPWQTNQRARMMHETRWKYEPSKVIETWDGLIQEAHTKRTSRSISIETDHPIATDSPDNLHPLGALRNNRCPKILKRIFSSREDSCLLDLGCAGGGLVAEALECGYSAIGIEGSAHPLSDVADSDWKRYPDCFYTADITKPFFLRNSLGQILQFETITAFEVFEHIPEGNLPALMKNIQEHASQDAICVFSISNDSSVSEEVELHVTRKSREWWDEFFRQYGWRTASLQKEFIEPDDWCGWIGVSTMHFVLEKDL